MTIILEAKNLCVEAQGTIILDHINFTVQKGDFISIVGASGSGKTTFLQALSGIRPIRDGTVTVDGEELSTLNDNKRANLRLTQFGFVFQDNFFNSDLSIYDNILLPTLALKNKYNHHEYIIKLSEEIGIAQILEREVTEVSGGQLQRAGICRALVNHPIILFADEPTGALNSKASKRVMELLEHINKKGVTIIMVTHDAAAAAYAKKAICMGDGEIKSTLELPNELILSEKTRQINTWTEQHIQ